MQAGAPDSEADHTEAILWKTNAKPGWNYGFGKRPLFFSWPFANAF
jgi:hypothetical protein